MIRILGTHSKVYAVPNETGLFLSDDESFIRKELKKISDITIKNKKLAWVEKTPKHVTQVEKIFGFFVYIDPGLGECLSV